MWKSGKQILNVNDEARAFRRDVLTVDHARKNAYRHAYWMARVTRELGAAFAKDLGNMHENCHVDLPIESPSDHVTDRINNAVGIKLAQKVSVWDVEQMIEEAWSQHHLALARNFRVFLVDGLQTADVRWQSPLVYLAKTFGVVPACSELEKATLKRLGVTVANDRVIGDEFPNIAKSHWEKWDDGFDGGENDKFW